MFQTLVDIPKANAKTHADHVAFKSGQQSETFYSLDQKTNQLARALKKANVKKGDRIGVYLHRCIESPIAVYGVMKAGAAFVPLDPGAPISRTLSIIERCGIKVLITSKTQEVSVRDILSRKSKIRFLVGLAVENENTDYLTWQDLLDVSDESFSEPLEPDDLAYIMFTSGSTGEPKGIMHTHYSGLSYARLSSNLYDLGTNDIVGSFSPLHFDMSTFGYFSAPFAKSTSIIVPDGYLFMISSLSKLIESEKMTVLYAVPEVFLNLMKSNLIRDYKKLRWIMYGGEPFPPKRLNELIKLLPWANISNVYGPAEVNQCTFHNISDIVNETRSIPLGKVWGETNIKIIDELENNVSVGEIGELLVHSSTMMKGYWANHPPTEDVFLKEVNKAGLAYYRTGDLVKVNSEGDLVFMGRKDRQIKIRGYRVELEEIENRISCLEGVFESAVFVTNSLEDKRIQAVYSRIEGKDISSQEILVELRKQLPKYAIPSFLDEMEQIPRTGSGKIDYATLKNTYSEIRPYN